MRCDVYYFNCWRLKLEGETENICVCTKACQPRYSWPLPALIYWEVKVGGTGMKGVRGAVFAGVYLLYLPNSSSRRKMMMAPTILDGLSWFSARFPSQSAELSEPGRQDTRAAAPAAVRERRAHIHDGRRAPAQEKQERARGRGRRGGRRCGCWGRDAGSRRTGSACRRGVRVQAAVPRVPGFAEAGPRVLERRA